MGYQCSNIPSNLKIIHVGDSEVGLFNLRKILRDVCHLGIEDETALKKELLQKIKEKNSISREREDLYAEALLREYRSFAQTQRPIQKQTSQGKGHPSKANGFFKRIFRKRRSL